MSTQPEQKPGRSKQDYQTPPEFLAAVKDRLGIQAFGIDLAASAENAVADQYYTLADNSLVRPWAFAAAGEWAWLNPPYANIGPWVRRAHEQSSRYGAKIAVLLPAGVGANWFRDYVHRKCTVLFLNGRITFVGCSTCYPKDCVLLLYGVDIGYEVWTWPQQIKKAVA